MHVCFIRSFEGTVILALKFSHPTSSFSVSWEKEQKRSNLMRIGTRLGKSCSSHKCTLIFFSPLLSFSFLNHESQQFPLLHYLLGAEQKLCCFDLWTRERNRTFCFFPWNDDDPLHILIGGLARKRMYGPPEKILMKTFDFKDTGNLVPFWFFFFSKTICRGILSITPASGWFLPHDLCFQDSDLNRCGMSQAVWAAQMARRTPWHGDNLRRES